MSNAIDVLKTRIKKLNDMQPDDAAKSVMYVMSRDCRVTANHALVAAQQHALKAELPLIVAFVTYDKQLGQRAREHIAFLLEGVRDVSAELKTKNIPFVLRTGDAKSGWKQLAKDFQPASIYFDFSPLRHAMHTKKSFAAACSVPVFMVDTHNVVPVWVASDKQEVGARTLRPKIHHHMPTYLHDAIPVKKHPHTWSEALYSESIGERTAEITANYPTNHTDISRFMPGEKAAHKALRQFVDQRLKGYAQNRNNPTIDSLSELSPYLHYGQLSSLSVALAVYEAVKHDSGRQSDEETLIEEMIVRKELSDNFCYYNPNYDKLKGAPEWAQKTLEKHKTDDREFTYTRQQFEAAQTHDEAWNAAQRQLTRTGKIHGYMRMYWAKKVLEWSASPQAALQTLLYLNDFYHIDGGDPNGYVGILWSIAGVHDRPWGERPVYGVIRSMVYTGLKRKFDIAAYIKQYS